MLEKRLPSSSSGRTSEAGQPAFAAARGEEWAAVRSPRVTMLSSRAKYAVRAALCLAEQDDSERWVATATIAEQESIPRKFLEAIVVELQANGILESRRGPGGGHRLRKPPAEITVADIIRIVDGPLALTPCASRTQFRACPDCRDIAACRLRTLMQRARDAVATVLEACSLADLCALPRPELLHDGKRKAAAPRLRAVATRRAPVSARSDRIAE